MRSATEWFDAYGVSHQNTINKAIHWVAIPVIVLSLLGLLQSIPFPADIPYLHWGTVVLAAAMVFYAMLSWTVAVGMGLFGIASIAVNQVIVSADLPLLPISLGAFFVAWLFQFIGHKIEGEKPSFFEDLQFLMIGPAWLLQFVYNKVGIPVETYKREPVATS